MLYKKTKLNNGLKILSIFNKEIDILTLELNFKIGIDLEIKEKELEIGHFMEHLFTLFTSNKYNDGKQNRELLYLKNIDVDAEIVQKNINFTLEFKAKYLDTVLDLVCNALTDYVCDESLFKQEKNAVVEELSEMIEDTNYKLNTKIDKVIYKGHCREIDQKRRLNNCKKLKIEDLIQYHKKYFIPCNLVISISGNKTHNDFVSKIKHYLKDFSNNNNKVIVYKKFKKSHKKKKMPSIIYQYKDSSTCSLKIIFPAKYILSDNKVYDIISLLTLISDDINAILLKRLRNEEGLVYYLISDYEFDELDNNLSFVIFESSVDKKNINKVVNIIYEELSNLKKKFIDQKSINKFKEKVKIDYIKSKYDKNPSKALEIYSKNFLWDKPIIDYDKEWKKYYNIDKYKLKNIANELFKFNESYICYNGNSNCLKLN